MVTANRAALARRAVRCFARQTWPARELIIVDDGDEDYAPMLNEFAGIAVRYERLPRRDSVRLGGLRNVTLELAAGDHCMQWDDDEWYHPRRIETQMTALAAAGGGACVIRNTLMHLDDPALVEHLYRTGLRAGTPGTILHERTAVRYPNVARGEDSDFRDALRRTRRVHVLDAGLSHLLVRCFHGRNTWHRQHFFERLHYTAGDKVQYAVAKYLRGNLLTHPAFRLNAEERQAAAAFLEDSRALGLLSASKGQELA
jgi:glycosyltransferase involved in cell wall biosynthesis